MNGWEFLYPAVDRPTQSWRDDSVNVDIFAQHVEAINWRLTELYRRGANGSIQPQPDLLSIAFKELGTVSEELQVALEELYRQREEVANTRVALEAERQRYQELFEFSPDACLVTDEQGTIREANRAAAKLFNARQQFLVGKPLVVFIPPEQRKSFYSELLRRQLRDWVQEWVVPIQPRHGEQFDAALMVGAIRTPEGKLVGMRICMRDITERRRAEAALDANDYDPARDRPWHYYPKGEIIPLKPQTIWLVCQGLVKLNTMNENGEEILVGLAKPSTAFGPGLTSLQIYQATALSNDVQLASISLTEVAASPRLAQSLLSQINQRLRQTESLVAIAGRRRVTDRLYALLQLLKDEIGEPIPSGCRLSARLTHQDLADACCSTRVTVTRLLNQLEREGKIGFDSKHHMILKKDLF